MNTEANMSRDITLYACLSLAFLIGSFSLTMPYLQSRRDELLCDSFCQGSLTSLRSILGLIGSAVMGRLSDSLAQRSQGRSVCLYIGNVASFLGLVLSVTMTTRRGLWWSIIPGALFQQNFSIFKAMITESLHHQHSSPEDTATARTSSFGKLGMSAGLAFMVGPLMGALLVSTFSSAVHLAMIMILISTLFLFQISSLRPNLSTSQEEELNEKLKGRQSNSNNTNTTLNEIKVLWSQASFSAIQSTWSLLMKKNISSSAPMDDTPAWRSPPALFIMSIRLCMALAFHIFQLIWTVSLKRRFNFSPSDHGKFMSFVGLTYALSQGFIAKRIVSTWASPSKDGVVKTSRQRVHVIQVCCIILGLGRYLAFHTTHLVVVYGLFGAIITSLGVLNTILTSDTSSIAPVSQMGSLYGVMESVESASGILGPFLGGFITHPLLSVILMYSIVFLLITFGYDRFILKTVEIDAKKRT